MNQSPSSPSEDSTLRLEQRIAVLEKTHRREKRIWQGVALLALSSLLVAAGPQDANTVKAQRFELTDKEGHVRAIIGELPVFPTFPDGEKAIGFAVTSPDGKQVGRLIARSSGDGTTAAGVFDVISPATGRKLFSAGSITWENDVTEGQIEVNRDSGAFSATLFPSSLTLSVQIAPVAQTSAAVLSVSDDLSARLSLGGATADFNTFLVSEEKAPRIEVQKGSELKTFGFLKP